jgi:hypothetical protein
MAMASEEVPNSSSDITNFYVKILTRPTAIEGEKGIFQSSGQILAASKVSASKLASNVSELCRYVGLVFANASTAANELELECLEVQLEITASGEVRLIGALSTELKGGLTLTFRRRATEP